MVDSDDRHDTKDIEAVLPRDWSRCRSVAVHLKRDPSGRHETVAWPVASRAFGKRYVTTTVVPDTVLLGAGGEYGSNTEPEPAPASTVTVNPLSERVAGCVPGGAGDLGGPASA